jgi:hypothetical protein
MPRQINVCSERAQRAASQSQRFCYAMIPDLILISIECNYEMCIGNLSVGSSIGFSWNVNCECGILIKRTCISLFNESNWQFT